MATGNPNQLIVDLEKCIGCWACTHVCPADLITFVEQDGQRVLHFARICHEEEGEGEGQGGNCTRCADVCPEEAITLAPMTETVLEDGYLTATFDLLDCQRCGAPFTTARIVDSLLEVIPAEFQTNAMGTAWVRLCPRCRQVTEGERVAQEWVMARWPEG